MSLTSVEKNINSDILTYLENRVNAIPALQKIRQEAFDVLQRNGLPGHKHEEYRYIPLTKALDNFDFTSVTASGVSKDSVSKFIIPDTDTYTVVLVNGIYQPALSSALQVKGLTVRPLAEELEKSPETGAQYASSFSEAAHDPFTAWNIIGWNTGLFISVDNNIQIDKPLAIYNLVDVQEAPVVQVTRHLIVVGKNSELSVLQKNNAIGNHRHFLNTVTEAVVDVNAGLNFYTLQDEPGEHVQFNRTHILQSNASRVNSYCISLDGKLIRNNLQLTIDGEGCESHMYGLYLLKGDSLVDNHTVADHRKPNSISNELYKGIMDDRSRGVFNGKIFVRPNAQKTNAFQSNRNILLTGSARVNTKPQLEIWADDVKCSHGCTSGQLDEEALFYLQTRGILKADAQAMLLYAFAGEVIDTVTIPPVKTYLEKVIRKRLHSND